MGSAAFFWPLGARLSWPPLCPLDLLLNCKREILKRQQSWRAYSEVRLVQINRCVSSEKISFKPGAVRVLSLSSAGAVPFALIGPPPSAGALPALRFCFILLLKGSCPKGEEWGAGEGRLRSYGDCPSAR